MEVSAGVAQLEEQRICNPWAAGSSPASGFQERRAHLAPEADRLPVPAHAFEAPRVRFEVLDEDGNVVYPQPQ